MDTKNNANDTKLKFSDITEDITFHGKNHEEVLRICGNGKFLVKGKEVTTDREVYYAMRRFLQLGEKSNTLSADKPREIWRKVIAFDFDGVISSYEGWKGVDVFGQPNMVVLRVMYKLRTDGWKIVIFTTRIETPKLREWLETHNVPYDAINSTDHNPPNTSIKPIYHVIVDDRAVRYKGQDITALMNDIMDTYNENKIQYNHKTNE